MVGLNVAELGGRPAVADDRPLAVFLTVAEPLRQHPLAGLQAALASADTPPVDRRAP